MRNCPVGPPDRSRVLLTCLVVRWVDPIILLVVKLIAVNIAWLLQRIISTVHSAVRGGQLFAR